MKIPNWLKVVFGLLFMAFLWWHPASRQILWFILPLGSGMDDLIFLLLSGAAAAIAFVNGWVSIPKVLKWLFQNNKGEGETNER